MNEYLIVLGLFISALPGWYYWIKAGNNLSEKGKQHQFKYFLYNGYVPEDYYTEEGIFYFRRGKRMVIIPILYFIGAIVLFLLKYSVIAA